MKAFAEVLHYFLRVEYYFHLKSDQNHVLHYTPTFYDVR